MSRIDEYYVIKDRYKNFDSGTIFHCDGMQIVPIHNSKELIETPPNDWIKITSNLAHYLKSKCLFERLDVYESRVMDQINKLKIKDKCIYLGGELKQECTITDKKESNGELIFTIRNENAEIHKVCANDIELLSDNKKIEKKYFFRINEGINNESSCVFVISDGRIENYTGQTISDNSKVKILKSSIEVSAEEARILHNVMERGKTQKDKDKMNQNNDNKNKKCDNLVNKHNKYRKFSKDGYKEIEGDFKDMKDNDIKIVKIYENDEFINFTKTILKDVFPKNDDFTLDFSVLNLRILSQVSLHSKAFTIAISTNDDLMKELRRILDIITIKEKLLQKEENILIYMISLYWHLLKSDQKISIPISESLEKCYRVSKFGRDIKIGVSLCLIYQIECSRPILGEVYLYLSEINLEDKNEVKYFTKDDVLIGLGKLSKLVDHDHILLGKLKKYLNNLSKLLKHDNPQFTNEIHAELKNIYRNLCIANKDSVNDVMNKLIKMAQLIVETFYKKYIANQEKMMDKIMLDCAMTTLNIICNLCSTNTVFVTTIVGNVGLMANLMKIFNKLMEKIKPLRIEGQFLEIIIFIYWKIIKSRASLDNYLIPKIGHCYKCPNVNDKVKVAAALCLSVLGAESHEDRLDIGSYLETLCTKEPIKLCGFSWTEICVGVANIALVAKSFNPKGIEDKETIPQNVDQDTEEASLPLSESNYKTVLTIEDYKTFVKEIVPFLCDVDSISAIKTSIICKDVTVAINVIEKTKNPIDLTEHNQILKDCIVKDNKDLLKVLLKKCKTSKINYKELLTLCRYSNEDIVALACKQFDSSQLTTEVNQQLLGIAYGYAIDRNKQYFLMFITACTNCNDYMMVNSYTPATETFLTKMLKELTVSQIEFIWALKTFDIHTHNFNGEAPIVIASRNVDKLQWLMDIRYGDFNEKDFVKAQDEAVKLEDDDKRKVREILFNYKKTQT